MFFKTHTATLFEAVEKDSVVLANQAIAAERSGDRDALLREVNEDGNSVLHEAVLKSSSNLVRVLLSAGADVLQRDAKGRTSLHLAVERNSLATLLVLLEGRDGKAVSQAIGTPDANQNTVVHYVAHYGDSMMMNKCLERCDPWVVVQRNTRGDTALHVAAARGSMDLVRTLLAQHADVAAANFKGRLARDFAAQEEHHDVVELLDEHMSQAGEVPAVDEGPVPDLYSPRSAKSKRVDGSQGFEAAAVASLHRQQSGTGFDVSAGPLFTPDEAAVYNMPILSAFSRSEVQQLCVEVRSLEVPEGPPGHVRKSDVRTIYRNWGIEWSVAVIDTMLLRLKLDNEQKTLDFEAIIRGLAFAKFAIADTALCASVSGPNPYSIYKFYSDPDLALMPRQALDELVAEFRRFDRDQNGTIDETELQQIMRDLGDDASLDNVRRLIKEVDLDDSGTIDFGEFFTIVRQLRQDASKEMGGFADVYARSTQRKQERVSLFGRGLHVLLDDDDTIFEREEAEKRRRQLLEPETVFRKGVATIGPCFWSMIVLLPIALVSVFFGVIPLGDPRKDDHYTDALVMSPIIFTMYGFLNVRAYLASVGDSSRCTLAELWHLLLALYLILMGFNGLIVFTEGLIEFGGFVNIALTYIVVFVGLYFHAKRRGRVTDEWMRSFSRFRKVVQTVFIFIIILCMYIVAFRESNEAGQYILVIALAAVAFIMKKILLSLTDPFPIEMAMLTAGFWVENLDDLFQTLAYPVIRDPAAYVLVWVVNFSANIAYLGFLTDPWFRFRVWIKNYLKGVFTGKSDPNAKPVEEDNLADRGHSNNHPGYIRRQMRFFLWKIISQFVAMIFYLCVAIVLRRSVNSEYFLFDSDLDEIYDFGSAADEFDGFSQEDFDNSIMYAGINAVFVALSGLFGMLWARRRHPRAFAQLYEIHGALTFDYNYFGYVLSILVSNAFIAVSMVMFHSKIWWAWIDIRDGAVIDRD